MADIIRILDLPVKKEWYQMIEKGEKPEEYREYTAYWEARLVDREELRPKPFTHVRFRYGYTRRTILFKFDGLTIGCGNPKWGAPVGREVFIIKFH